MILSSDCDNIVQKARIRYLIERLQLLRLVDVSDPKRNSPISSCFTFMSNRALALHKQTTYTQTLNMINDVKILKKYATPCGNNSIILTCK